MTEKPKDERTQEEKDREKQRSLDEAFWPESEWTCAIPQKGKP